MISVRQQLVKDLEPGTHSNNKPINVHPECFSKYRQGVLSAKPFSADCIGLCVPSYRPRSWDTLSAMALEFKVPMWEKDGIRCIMLPDYVYDFYNIEYKGITWSWSHNMVCLMHVSLKIPRPLPP